MFSKHDGSENGGFAEGVVVDVVREGKEWVVRSNGIYWRARPQTAANFSPGDFVKVVGRRGITLIIASE